MRRSTAKPTMAKPTATPVRLFVSYAHENAVWFARLRPVLKFDPPVVSVGVWHDQKLQAGDRWDKEIRDELEKMDVFVCLASWEFRNSEYIRGVELTRALAREKKHEVEIVPLVLYDINMKTDFKELYPFNPLPAWGKCWRDYEQNNGHYQDAFKLIHEGLRQAIEKARGRRKALRP